MSLSPGTQTAQTLRRSSSIWRSTRAQEDQVGLFLEWGLETQWAHDLRPGVIVLFESCCQMSEVLFDDLEDKL